MQFHYRLIIERRHVRALNEWTNRVRSEEHDEKSLQRKAIFAHQSKETHLSSHKL